MKISVTIYLGLLLSLALGAASCNKQLKVGDPNDPTLAVNATTETGLEELASGGVYINGFNNGDTWLGNSYFSLPYGYSELLGDVVSSADANQLVNQVSLPDYVILDDGVTKLTNTAPSRTVLRLGNTRAATGAGNNPFYYQWLNMYALNSAMNTVLSQLPTATFSGDSATKKATLQIWCHWWKGYAYASIGTLYYAGLVTDDPAGSSNNNFVSKDSMIIYSNQEFTKAATLLSAITNTNDFSTVLGNLIPSFCQVGNGGILTPTMWIHNINTMMARNIILNGLAPFVNGNPSASISGSSMSALTTADWQNITTLASAGIQTGDYVFTGRSTAVNGFFTATGGTVSALATGTNSSRTFQLSERFLQDFKSGDQRLANDFVDSPVYINQTGGFDFSTRWSLLNGGAGSTTVYLYGDNSIGGYELFIAGSWEENQLMLAEAAIRSGNIDGGLAYVDAVRAYQGSGVAPVSGTGLTLVQALNELVMERRAALAFRGLSFYDLRRWGWTYDISKGGGFYGATIYTSSKQLNTHSTINYDFLDYWDVPADETDLNKPSAGSAPTTNPN
jgi:hypothetical protein